MLSKFITYVIHTVFLFFCKREYKNFIKGDVLKIQQKKLKTLLYKSRNTVYGRKYGFSNIKDISDFQKNVPVTAYEDYISYIEEIRKGNQHVLTSEKVEMFELTSGSVSASKLIPYTLSLRKEFQAGIRPWLYSLYKMYPQLKWGKSYWSITPLTSLSHREESAVPIGFEEDSEYFGKFEKYLMELIFVNLHGIQKEKDMDSFYIKTLCALLSCRNLRLISIWSPSFLLLLLEFMDSRLEDILKNIKDGKRREEVKRYVEKKEYGNIWKKLKIISCWGEGNSFFQLQKIKDIFPKAVIQEKGLLATEAFISFPLAGEAGNCLSYRSHFFEFISLEDGKIYDVSQISTGKEYEILVTTGGGLYRYSLGDIVEVTSLNKGIPRIKFNGRKGNISDLHGEKLNGIFLGKVMEPYLEENRVKYYMFAPDKEKGRYILFIKSDKYISSLEIDGKMRENFHYDYCRKLGQLKSLVIFMLTGNPEREYTEYCQNVLGQKLGNIKFRNLSTESGWENVHTGYFQKEE